MLVVEKDERADAQSRRIGDGYQALLKRVFVRSARERTPDRAALKREVERVAKLMKRLEGDH